MIKTLARYEIKQAFRSKWLLVLGLLYFSLSLLSLFLTESNRVEGFDGFTRQMASLLNISLFILPLFTLMIGSLLLAGEKEDGQYTLYKTYPVTASQYVLGKWLGLVTAFLLLLTAAYGVSVMVVAWTSTVRWSVVFFYYGMNVILVLTTLSIAFFIGFHVKNRLHALGVSLLIWAFLVLFYELLIIMISFLVPATQVQNVLTLSVFFNPIEVARVSAILWIEGGTFFGPTMYDFTKWAVSPTGIIFFIISVLAWLLIPLLLSILNMRKGRDS